MKFALHESSVSANLLGEVPCQAPKVAGFPNNFKVGLTGIMNHIGHIKSVWYGDLSYHRTTCKHHTGSSSLERQIEGEGGIGIPVSCLAKKIDDDGNEHGHGDQGK